MALVYVSLIINVVSVHLLAIWNFFISEIPIQSSALFPFGLTVFFLKIYRVLFPHLFSGRVHIS